MFSLVSLIPCSHDCKSGFLISRPLLNCLRSSPFFPPSHPSLTALSSQWSSFSSQTHCVHPDLRPVHGPSHCPSLWDEPSGEGMKLRLWWDESSGLFWCSPLTFSHEINEQINWQLIIPKINYRFSFFLLASRLWSPTTFPEENEMKRDICNFNFLCHFYRKLQKKEELSTWSKEIGKLQRGGTVLSYHFLQTIWKDMNNT